MLYNIRPILYHTYSTLTSKHQTLTFSKISLRVWAVILERYNPFFKLVIFPCFRTNPYTIMCVLTIGPFSHFGNKLKTHGKTLIEYLFFAVFSDTGFLCLS